jgi:hypothetical protein
MRVKQIEGGDKPPCEIKTGGKREMVSLSFNGSMLIEMQTKRSDVVKRRFKIVPTSDMIIPPVPGGKTETFGLKQAQLASRQG